MEELSNEQIKTLLEEAEGLRASGRYGEAAAIWEHFLRFAERAFGPDHPNTAISLNTLAGLYCDQGLYSQAKSLYERALAISEKALGPDHPDTANSLNNLALVYSMQGLYSQAEPLYQRALAIIEKTLGRDCPDIVPILNNLAGFYYDQKLYAQVEPFLQRALEIREKALGVDHLLAVSSLENLARLYRDQRIYSKAYPLFKRVLIIREKVLGPNHPDISNSLENLADSYRGQGLYSQAAELYERALEIVEREHGTDHPTTAFTLNNLAILYSQQGYYDQAESLMLRALAIRENSPGVDPLDLAITLDNLAGIYKNKGHYLRSEELMRRALEIIKSTIGEEHPTTVAILNNLALLYLEQGEYAQAEPVLKRALATRIKIQGEAHPDTADSIDSLGLLFRKLGRFDEAMELYSQAFTVRAKAFGVDHPEIALSLNNLAGIYREGGLYGEAELLYFRALAIIEKILGPDHERTAAVLSNLANVYGDQDLYADAEPLLMRALSVSEKKLGVDHPLVAKFLSNIAGLRRDQGFYAEAEPLYSRALAISENMLGLDHPSTTTLLNNLGFLLGDQGFYSESTDYLRRGLEAETTWLAREAPLQSADKRLFLSSIVGSSWKVLSSFIDFEPSAAELAFTAQLQRHGLLLDIQRRQALLARADPAVQQLASQIAALNGQLSDVSIAPAQRQGLRGRRDELETQLNRELPQLLIPKYSPAQVVEQLPSDGVLIAFQRFRPRIFNASPSQRWGEDRYLALILSSDGSIRHQQLGDAVLIDAAIRHAINTSASNNTDAEQRWADVSRLLIDPLRPFVRGRRQLFISPDAELHRIPFDALPSSPGLYRLLAEEVRLRVITSVRDLITLQEPAPLGSAPLVIANPNYDSGLSASATAGAKAVPHQRSAAVDGKRWDPLPASAAEGEQLASLLGIKAVTGDQATVSLLQMSRGPRILHIASHGFFVGDEDLPPEDPLQATIATNAVVQRFEGEDPLLRSGLVLAGANNWTLNHNDDGLLTAQEAAGLQLDGTELVVLSACSTAQGDLRTGEGVFGLQRAFTVAGARSTLLSLWKVDDAATAELMTRFYQRLKTGEGRADALAAVQAEFRNGLVQGPGGEDWSMPYYWAAWQLVGDWRPIEGL